MTTTFMELASSIGTCGAPNWPGLSRAAETEALETLFTSDADIHEIAAVISYHSYADMLIYPMGYKAQSDADGPRCGLSPNEQCVNPDFALYRNVFGDTHSGLWVDRQSVPSEEYPFFRDHGAALLYGVSGDTGHGVNYSPSFKALSITPEMQSGIWGWYIECESDPDDLISSAVDDQHDVLRRVLSAAPGLVTNVVEDAWGPNHVGIQAPGIWTREYRTGQHDTARATYTKSVWAPADTNWLTAIIGGMPYGLNPGRPGAEYNLYFLQHGPAFDPLQLPCDIVTTPAEGLNSSHERAPECADKVNLCDPTRLVANGFKLKEELRGNEQDCWWEASSDAELIKPGADTPFPGNTNNCYFTFSLEWSGLEASTKINIERRSNGTWERVLAINPGDPYYSYPASSQRIHSYVLEANNELPDRVPEFRIQVVDRAAYVRVFDPVVYCREGALP